MVASRSNGGMGCRRAQPPCAGIICYRDIAIDNQMVVYVFWFVQPAVPFCVGATGVYRPGRITNLAPDHGFIHRLAETDRNLGLTLGQIKLTVADHELDPQTSITCMKGVDDRCPSEAICHVRSAGQANSAYETFVARGEATFEGRHRCLHTLGSGPQFVCEFGQPVTAEMALYQPAADTPLNAAFVAMTPRVDAPRGQGIEGTSSHRFPNYPKIQKRSRPFACDSYPHPDNGVDQAQ